MKVGGREIRDILRAPFGKHHYVAAFNMLSVYERPVPMFFRYLSGLGGYPLEVRLKTPLGPLKLMAYSHHDLLTINEIFCRRDYPADAGDRVVVDFGSNIGISAAYFLSHAPLEAVYLFEPLPSNTTRLARNLEFAVGRYQLSEVAVGLADGMVEFGWEESGRYGGVGIKTGNYVNVVCEDSNRVLAEVISRHGGIDILKVDIESMEQQLIERIPAELASKIRKIFVEWVFRTNPLNITHTMRQYGTVAQFLRRA